MKLRLIVQDDPVERLTLSVHTSVLEKLREYKTFYETSLGGKVQQNYLVEEMLKSCMAEDKDFQRYLKNSEGKPKAADGSGANLDDEGSGQQTGSSSEQ